MSVVHLHRKDDAAREIVFRQMEEAGGKNGVMAPVYIEYERFRTP
jgi:hypothetical protein